MISDTNSGQVPPARSNSSNRASSRAGQTVSAPIEYPVDVSVKNMLAAGAHFGHQTEKWNPKMLPYIFCAKNGIHIINLDMTLDRWKRARKFIVDITSRGGSVLFVGTKLQARDIVQQEAARCGAFYVTTRWLGGTLSNFQTIKNSIDRMRKLEDLLVQAEDPNTKVKLSKKERLEIHREVEKLSESLGGIRHMKRLPDAVFIVDVVKEDIAVKESRRLKIPVIALVDTNASPDGLDFAIPCNDDATRAIRLMLAGAGDAVMEGRGLFEARSPRERQEISGEETPREERRGRRTEAKLEPAPEKPNTEASAS